MPMQYNMPRAKYAAVVTTHNEVGTIAKLVKDLLLWCDAVYVVDEGSTDRTAEFASRHGATVLSHEGGIGPCLMMGWKMAVANGADWVIQLDAGGSHSPDDLFRFRYVSMVGGPHYDALIGSRFVRGGRHLGNPVRKLMSWLAAVMCNWQMQVNHMGYDASEEWIYDWTSGYRLFSRETIYFLTAYSYETTMHSWQIEVLRRLKLGNKNIREVPITYRAGRSSLSWRIIWDAFKVWRAL